MSARELSRRIVLRGAGGVAIALPLVPVARRHAAAAAPVPERFVTFFFGNGWPPEYTERSFDSEALVPLRPFVRKLTMVRDIEAASARASKAMPHPAGGASFAVGRAGKNELTADGPSLDYAAYRAARADTPLSVLCAALYHWDIDPVRYMHSWRGVDQPNPALRKPLALFQRLFGGQAYAGTAEAAGRSAADVERARQRRLRAKRSVLDAVVDGTRALMSDRSGLSRTVRARLADHLETVRGLERQIAALEQNTGAGSCRRPAPPPDIEAHGECHFADGCPPSGGASNWDEIWPMLAELYALALRCDLVRFGNLTCTAAGDRYSLYDLPNIVHFLAHDWRPDHESQFIRSVTWLMGKLAVFLAKLDDPSQPEPDGRTLLDNTTVLIGTEMGNPAAHSFEHLTYLIAGGRHFRPGAHDLGNRATDVDLYSTVASALGVNTPFGEPAFFRGLIDSIRA